MDKIDQILAQDIGGNSIEHHGVKGQKWGVRKYKEARARGIAASKMNLKAAGERYEAQKSYVHNGKKMDKIMAKRDAVSNQLKSAKPNSRKAAQYTSKMNKYNSKAQEYADKRKANEKDYNKADKDVAKFQNEYMSELSKAASQKVSIKDRTIAKELIMGAFNMTYNPSSKDTFDEDVMTYRSVHHSDKQMPEYRATVSTTDSIEHHGVKGQKWGVRRRVQSLLGGSGQVPRAAAAASKAREKSWKKVYANRSSMSTPQLREKVNRLTLENQLKQQVSIASPAQKSVARQVITNVGTELLKNAAHQAGQQMLKQAMKKVPV